jgi:hypothetical protein
MLVSYSAMKFSAAQHYSGYSFSRSRLYRSASLPQTLQAMFDPRLTKQAVTSIAGLTEFLCLPIRDSDPNGDPLDRQTFLASLGDDSEVCTPVRVSDESITGCFIGLTTRAAAARTGWRVATSDPVQHLIPADGVTPPGHRAIHCWQTDTDDDHPVLVAIPAVQLVALGEDCEIPELDFTKPPPTDFSPAQHFAFAVGFLQQYFGGRSLHVVPDFNNVLAVSTAGLNGLNLVPTVDTPLSFLVPGSPPEIEMSQRFEMERVSTASVQSSPTAAIIPQSITKSVRS